MSRISKLDQSWEKLFSKYEILKKVESNGYFQITSTKINEFREARLMTKFDHESQLPSLFKKNKLSILPITRGSYLIGRYETFHKFNQDPADEEHFVFPPLESMDHNKITSESIAINCAYISRILHNFVGEKELQPTVNGRMSSSEFNFEIRVSPNSSQRIQVLNSQIEIDGGFEGENSLILIEAKNYISNDFLIRQLYYPYRLWENKVSKKVRPVFLTYSNGEFHLREYAFDLSDNYNSIRLIHHKKYIIQGESFNIEMLQKILAHTKIIPEPEKTPFPQADNFKRIINLCELLFEKNFLSKEEITENYDFVKRQTDYYTNAAKYLGLIEVYRDEVTNQIGCCLTDSGKKILTTNLIKRQKLFIQKILSFQVFNKTLKLYLSKGVSPSKDEIVQIMKESNLPSIESDVTYKRRTSTVSNWINWILEQVED